MAKLVIRSDGLPAETIELKKGTSRFGRSAENDFQIEHSTVSRFHCEITIREDGMFVRDLDSANGTYLNDEPIDHARLEKGQVLRLGDVKMEIKEVPKDAPSAEAIRCHNHPSLPASMKCSQCGKTFCGTCIHILKRLNGQYLRLCPVCSGHCVPLEGMSKGPAKSIFSNIMGKLLKKRTTVQKPFDEGNVA